MNMDFDQKLNLIIKLISTGKFYSFKLIDMSVYFKRPLI